MDRKTEEEAHGSAIRDDDNAASRRLGRAGGQTHFPSGTLAAQDLLEALTP